MTKKTWRQYCREVIYHGLLEYEAQALCLHQQIDPAKCKRHISKHCYPFGDRKYFPYKVWLQECNRIPDFWAVCACANQYPAWAASSKPATRKPSVPKVSPSQLSLFT